MSAQPQQLSSCCVSGHLHSGTPKGKVEKVGGLDTYVTGDQSNKNKSLIFITDIFGYHLPNAQLLADEYADKGYLVYLPDISRGNYVPHELLKPIAPLKSDPEPSLLDKTTNTAKVAANLGPWLAKNRESVVRPLIEETVRAVRSAAGPDGKVGAIGFCWGGRYAVLLATKSWQQTQVDAAFACHPSFLSVPAEVEDVVKPVAIGVGDADVMMSVDQAKQSKEILEGSKGGEVKIYPNAVHGFSIRGDQNDDEEKKLKEEIFEQAVSWFNKHL